MDDNYFDKIHDLLLQQKPDSQGYFFVGDWEIVDRPNWCVGKPNSEPFINDETLNHFAYSNFIAKDSQYSSFTGQLAQEILGTEKFILFKGELQTGLTEFWATTASLM